MDSAYLAELLAGDGQLDAAIEVLSQPGRAQSARGANRTFLATLLVQAHRVNEAIAVSHVRTVRPELTRTQDSWAAG